MARSTKPERAKQSGEFCLFDESVVSTTDVDEELPRDERGRAKIKRQYVELLGVRVDKLRGRILNRERINKTLEGIYFICHRCLRVCHNLDEGLVEDPHNEAHVCVPCKKALTTPPRPAKRAPAKSKKKVTKKKAVAKKARTKKRATKARGS